jgi:hypothetical protein
MMEPIEATNALLELTNICQELQRKIDYFEEEPYNAVKTIFNKQSEYEDAFLEYAYEHGLWGLPDSEPMKEPSDDEIHKMRCEFTEYWIDLHGYDDNIKYTIFDTNNPTQEHIFPEKSSEQPTWESIATDFQEFAKWEDYIVPMLPVTLEYCHYQYAWLKYMENVESPDVCYVIHTLGIENRMKGVFPDEMFEQFLKDQDIFV